MTTKTPTQPHYPSTSAFPALAQTFSHFARSTHERIYRNRANGVKDTGIHDFLNRIPHLCLEILDTSYEAGVNLLFETFHQLEHGSIRSIIGDFTIHHLDTLEKTSPDKAEQIAFMIQQSLSETDDESIQYIMRINIHETVNYYDEQGWFPEQLNSLKRQLTTPSKWDLPRQKQEKKIIKDELFPDEVIQEEPINMSPGHTPYLDLGLFVIDDEIDMESLRYLPLTELFYDAIKETFYDKNGDVREDINEDDYIAFDRVLHDLYDVSDKFMYDFLLQALDDYYRPENQQIVPYIVADFMQQKLNSDLNQDLLEKDYYDYGTEICQRFLVTADDEFQKEIALINLHGLIEHFRQKNAVAELIQQKDLYLTPYDQDSQGQIMAKEFVANNYKITVHKKPPQP